MSVTWVEKSELAGVVAERVLITDVVLDVGPGIRPQTHFEPRVHVCIEAHRPYIERLRAERGADPRFVFLNAPWEQAMALLPDKSVDTVFALDFIEHLEKAQGLALLREAERVAREQVVIFTPLGYYPQSYDDPSQPDRWGMDGGYWQTHRSGWTPEDFGAGWEVVCCKAFHTVDEHDRPLEVPFGAIWALHTVQRGPDGRPRRTVAEAARSRLGARARRLSRTVLPRPVYERLRGAWHAVGGRR